MTGEVAAASTASFAHPSVASRGCSCQGLQAIEPAADELPAAGSLLAIDHLADLIVRTDPALGAALRKRALAPFADLPEARRDPLLDTVRSWLLHAGNRTEVGRELHVHPQTVSYRMDRVRDLLGQDLDDPRHRWELLLALMSGQAPPTR